MLHRATDSSCRFYTNLTVFKIEIYGTFSRRYLHENEAWHAPTFAFYFCLNVIFHNVLLYALSVKKLLLKPNFCF